MLIELFWLVLYISLASIATLSLMFTPYLRLTSLGWLIAIWSIPLAGALFFLLTVVKSRRMAKRVLTRDPDAPVYSLFERLGLHYEFPHYVAMHSPEILRDEAFFDALLEAIRSAKTRVWLTTYIFGGDVRTHLMDALDDAHTRGVDVRVMLDRVGSKMLFAPKRKVNETFGNTFSVSVIHASRLKSVVYLEKRLHTKIVLCDDRAFVGSHNLRGKILTHASDFIRNISMAVSGDVIQQVENTFIELWRMNTGEALATQSVGYELKRTLDEDGVYPARVIASDPITRSRHFNRYLTVLFTAARRRILVWMPYIIPTHSMRMILISASVIGLDVRVLFPRKTESWLVDNAHELVIRELVDSGVRCAYSDGPFDHSKVLVVDDLVMVGSSNLDYRSLYRNFEANMEIHNQKLAEEFVALFDEAFAAASEVDELNPHPIRHLKNQITSLIAGLY